MTGRGCVIRVVGRSDVVMVMMLGFGRRDGFRAMMMTGSRLVVRANTKRRYALKSKEECDQTSKMSFIEHSIKTISTNGRFCLAC